MPHVKKAINFEDGQTLPKGDDRHHRDRRTETGRRRSRRETDRQKAKRSVRKHRFEPSIRVRLSQISKEKNDLAGLLTFATDILLIAAAIWAATWSAWVYPISALVIGTRMRGLATILHESSHLTLCKTRWLSKAIGSVSGWTIFQTFHAYKASHVEEHHPHLGDPERDPDLINYTNQGLFEASPRSLFTEHLLPLALGLKSYTNLRNLVKDRLLPKDWNSLPVSAKTEYFGFAAFWGCLVGGLAATGYLWAFALFWMVPYLTVFQAVNWLIELSEHFPLIKLFKNELHVTRNRRGNALENFFTGIHGENWHLVHHVHPGIPFNKLKEAHQIMMEDPTYRAANEGSGGLFVKGPNGEPSILSLMAEQLAEAQSQATERN